MLEIRKKSRKKWPWVSYVPPRKNHVRDLAMVIILHCCCSRFPRHSKCRMTPLTPPPPSCPYLTIPAVSTSKSFRHIPGYNVITALPCRRPHLPRRPYCLLCITSVRVSVVTSI